MAENLDLDRIITEVRTAAEECNTFIVEDAPSIDNISVPSVSIRGSEFPRFIRHLRPRLIYILTTPFDVGSEILEPLEDEDETILERPVFKKLISKWNYRNGQICRAAFFVMFDGILHGVVEEADWLTEFESEIDGPLEELEQAQEKYEQKLEAEERARLATYTRQLIADPRYSAPKVGIAKRTALAEVLFPDLDKQSIRTIVDQAEKEYWLTNAAR